MEFNNIDKFILRLKENFIGRKSLFIYKNMEYLERAFIVNNLQYYSENKEWVIGHLPFVRLDVRRQKSEAKR